MLWYHFRHRILPVVAFLTVHHLIFAVLFVKKSGLLTDTLQNRNYGFHFFRQRIFHFRRNLIIGSAVYNSVCNQFLQRRCQNCICNISHFFSQLAVAQNLFWNQNADDSGIPFTSKNPQPVFQRTADVFFQFSLIHYLNLPVFYPFFHRSRNAACFYVQSRLFVSSYITTPCADQFIIQIQLQYQYNSPARQFQYARHVLSSS